MEDKLEDYTYEDWLEDIALENFLEIQEYINR